MMITFCVGLFMSIFGTLLIRFGLSGKMKNNTYKSKTCDEISDGIFLIVAGFVIMIAPLS